MRFLNNSSLEGLRVRQRNRPSFRAFAKASGQYGMRAVCFSPCIFEGRWAQNDLSESDAGVFDGADVTTASSRAPSLAGAVILYPFLRYSTNDGYDVAGAELVDLRRVRRVSASLVCFGRARSIQGPTDGAVLSEPVYRETAALYPVGRNTARPFHLDHWLGVSLVCFGTQGFPPLCSIAKPYGARRAPERFGSDPIERRN